MSRIGKQPVIIPNGVTVSVQGQTVTIKGPKGELAQEFNPAVRIALKDEDGAKTIVVTVADESDKFVRAQWGTARAILQNMVKGVVETFSSQLEVNGVGYRVNMRGKDIVLNIGFSHEVPYIIPQGIEATVEGNIITIKGADKHLVGEVAANIRRIRKPEPYKGKGIKYVGEVVRRKSGKAQKAAAA